jgi:uncharacterized spore protein YtfJ
MDVQDVITGARRTVSARRIFGRPYEQDGVAVIPAAKIRGGGGGGGGEQSDGSTGAGSGFGMSGRPAGVYEIRNGAVRWRPAIDVNRAILGTQVILIVALFVIRSILRPPPRSLLRRVLSRR